MSFLRISAGKRFVPLAALLLGVALLSGCQLPLGGWFGSSPRVRPCELPPNLPKAELVQHLNTGALRMSGWRSTNVEISSAGMPIKLSGVIAVERPRKFRLRAGLVTGNEADLGSNDERFWFWMRRSPHKRILTASHKHAQRVEHLMNLPFQPDWLMEVLGVIPIDESEFVMQPEPNRAGIVSLVSDRETAAGEAVRRVMLVDTCHGFVVAHELYDQQNVLIARAELNGYRVDAASGVSLPHQIHLDWPAAGMAITMNIGPIEVNPRGMPEQTWQLPAIPGYPVLDLDRVQTIGMRSLPGARSGRARVRSSDVDTEIPRPRLQQTGWDRTGFVPPVDRTPRQTVQSAGRGGFAAVDSLEEPPWDDAPPFENPPVQNGVPQAGFVASARNEAGRVRRRGAGGLREPVRYVALEEEPPWDARREPPRERRGAGNEGIDPRLVRARRPVSLIDLLKKPLSGFRRRP